MSLLDRIRGANRHDFAGFVPWLVDGCRVGCVRHAFLDVLCEWPRVFRPASDALRLAPELERACVARRTESVAQVCAALRDRGLVPGWREERYPVCTAWGRPALLLLERAAVPLFGVTAYGVHVNGHVTRAGEAERMWIARRSMTKPTGPGKLDQMVAGGQPHGVGLMENVLKECAEEAGIPAALARRARAVGAITYVLETDQGIRPDVIFNFDLPVPDGFEPRNADGEVEGFYLKTLEEVHEILERGDEFKFNCALVAIDFLVRHGHVPADHEDYQALVLGLRPDLTRVPPSWVDAR